MTDRIASLGDLRPGDLMFTNIGGLVPGIFPVKLGQLLLGERVRIGPLSIDHVGVVVAGGTFPQVVEAMPTGARKRELTFSKDWADGTAYCRIPEDYPGQASDAAAIARAMIGTPYSFLSYLALATWKWGWKSERLATWINRRKPYGGPALLPTGAIMTGTGCLPCEAICSVLADQAWTLAGYDNLIRGTRPQVVTPGMLAMQLTHRPGVIWAGKGILS